MCHSCIGSVWMDTAGGCVGQLPASELCGNACGGLSHRQGALGGLCWGGLAHGVQTPDTCPQQVPIKEPTMTEAKTTKLALDQKRLEAAKRSLDKRRGGAGLQSLP